MSLPRRSIGRPVAVAMLFVAVAFLGLISFARLPIDHNARQIAFFGGLARRFGKDVSACGRLIIVERRLGKQALKEVVGRGVSGRAVHLRSRDEIRVVHEVNVRGLDHPLEGATEGHAAKHHRVRGLLVRLGMNE